MRQLLLIFTFVLAFMVSATAQDDYYRRKADGYTREAEYYQSKADGYRREAEYRLKRAEDYQREVAYYTPR